MRQSERQRKILNRLASESYASVQELQSLVGASEATIRRDLRQLAEVGGIRRVHGGVELPENIGHHLSGSPFSQNLQLRVPQKRAIASTAASLIEDGETIVIDGGSTTFMMCPFLRDKALTVLTNSLPIIDQLLRAPRIRLLVPGGEIFREQNIILSPFEQDGTAECFASTMFMGAQAITSAGLLQADSILIRAEQRLMERAKRVIVLADSSKFARDAGLVLCPLERIHTVVSDTGLEPHHRKMLERAGVQLILAKIV